MKLLIMYKKVRCKQIIEQVRCYWYETMGVNRLAAKFVCIYGGGRQADT